jgi:hypothetical protein
MHAAQFTPINLTLATPSYFELSLLLLHAAKAKKKRESMFKRKQKKENKPRVLQL